MEERKARLKALIKHWIEHSAEHQKTFQKWSEEAEKMNLIETSKYLREAAESVDETIKYLEKALEEM